MATQIGGVSLLSRAGYIRRNGDSSTFKLKSGGHKFGINTTVPTRIVEINGPDNVNGGSLRLTFDATSGSASKYTDFIVGSTGALTVSSKNGVGISTVVLNSEYEVITHGTTTGEQWTDLGASTGDAVPTIGTIFTASINGTNAMGTGTIEAVATKNDITFTNDLVVEGNFTVSGSSTIIDSVTLVTVDNNIQIGTVSSPTDDTADGGGLTLKGDTDKTILWSKTDDYWHFNQGIAVDGHFSASTKSFNIPHPTKKDARLVHGSLEGAEHGVYFRGNSTQKEIDLPDYWTNLVDSDTITVQLTAIGSKQDLWVVEVKENKVFIESEQENVSFFYLIQAERKDVDKLEVEVEA